VNQFSTKLREIANQIDEYGHQSGHFSSRNPNPNLQFANKDFSAIAEQMYRARRARDKSFGIPGLFNDAAWDILLDLLINERRFNNVSVTSACIASCVPPTTALRWLSTLEEYGLIERHQDPADARRTFVMLTRLGRQKTSHALCHGLDLSPSTKHL
jgi:DNA-binding MarR family transcriptional regulator